MIVLDTHAWVWWLSADRALSKPARSAIGGAAEESAVRVSSISVWEVAMLVAAGRLELRMELEDRLAEAEKVSAVRFVPVDNRLAAQSTKLPGRMHADPADRIIVATARALGAPLVTKDRKLRTYRHVETLW